MKTKFIAVLTALILTFQGMAFADYQLGTSSDELTVSGTAEPYAQVSFALLDADNLGGSDAETTLTAYYNKVDADVTITNTEVFYFRNIEAGADGKWSYTLPMTGIETKNLTLVPSVGEAEYIQYASMAFRTGMIPQLKLAAAEDDDCKTLTSKISYYIDYIADRANQYNKLTDKKKVAAFNKTMISGLDESSSASLGILKEGVDTAILVCSIDEGKITDFDTVMSIVSYDKTQKANISETGKEKLVSLLKNNDYTSVDNYKDTAAKQFALQLFNYNTNQSAENLLAVLETNNSVLKLDFTELYKLSSAMQAQAAKQLAAKKSESTQKAQEFLDDISEELYIEENADSDDNGGGGGGGGGGGFGGGSSTTVSENKPTNASAASSITNQYLTEQKYIYSDMNEADWAADAIYNLAQEGIVNGYADNTFKPLNSITRAEFTKLVVMTFFSEHQFEFSGNFKDIAESEWYADYVNTAYNMGVISGDENGFFNPNQTISRQDMAVIIYNAGLKFNLFEDASDYTFFADDTEIADYAKKAVYTLKNEKVINGVGENTFAPLANADRASAAKIIWSLMENSAE